MDIREKKHRREDEFYTGEVTIAFTVNVQDRKPHLANHEIVSALVDILKSSAELYDSHVLVYVFMPDHLHVLIRGMNKESRPKKAMDKFKEKSGWWLYRNHPHIHWQKDYYDHRVRDTEGWQAQAQYFLANPVRAGLVEEWRSWPHMGSCHYDFDEIISGAIWS